MSTLGYVPGQYAYEGLPETHWIKQPAVNYDSERKDFADRPAPILTWKEAGAVQAAVRYAMRVATACGMVQPDPDTVAIAVAFALCGARPLPCEQEKAP